MAFASGPIGAGAEAVWHSIWLLDLDSGVIGTIANDPSRDLRRPAWSPDGERIVFDAGVMPEAARRTLHVIPAGGGEVGSPIGAGSQPAWRPRLGAAPSATPEGSTTPTATGGATATVIATATPPEVPTLPVLPTLEPFPTFPPPEPTMPGPAPTFPRPSATPTATEAASPTPIVTAGTPGSRAFLPITHNGSDATAMPSPEATATTDPNATATPGPDPTLDPPSPGPPAAVGEGNGWGLGFGGEAVVVLNPG
jgi:hypothetical protein